MGATLTLEQVLDDAITTRLREAWTMLPAVITGVSGGMVTVQPIPNDIQNGEQVRLPSLTVRACFPAQTAGVVYPLQTGDVGLVVFACRPVGALLQSGAGAVELRDTRTHSLSDGFFLPVGALREPPATVPIARDGDACVLGPGWAVWIADVSKAAGATPPSLPFATVSASSNVGAT